MRMVLRLTALLAVLLIGLSAQVSAEAARGTADEAKAMVARAIAAYDAEGSAALAEMNAPSTAFRDRDLYVFVYGPDRRIAAHGADAAHVGHDVAEYADVDGKRFAVEIMERATADGVWVDYKWKDPLSGEERPKSTWVVLHDGYVFGCGIYKD